MRFISTYILTFISFIIFSFSNSVAGEYDVAVVIGNRNYQDKAISDVEFAQNDAKNIAQYLKELMGVPEDNIIKLVNATSGDFVKTFGNKEDHKGLLWQKADPLGRSKILIYFSGHGYPSITGGRLLPTDASHNAAALVGFPLSDLISNVSKIEATNSIILLDSCFSGLTQNGPLVTAASPLYNKDQQYDLPENMTLITAAGNSEIASWHMEKKQGLFTYHLLNGLYGAGDLNGDRMVDVSEVKKYLDTSMTFDARRFFARSQFAFVSGDENIILGEVSELHVPNNMEHSDTSISQILNNNDVVPIVMSGNSLSTSGNMHVRPTPPNISPYIVKPKPNKRRKKHLRKKPLPRY